MSTVINNPGEGESSNSVVNAVIGIIVVILVLILFFVYALPAMRNSNTETKEPQNNTLDVNVNLPNDLPDTTTTQ